MGKVQEKFKGTYRDPNINIHELSKSNENAEMIHLFTKSKFIIIVYQNSALFNICHKYDNPILTNA